MVWVLVNRTKGKQKTRIRLESGKLTPAFEYPAQAEKYIQKYLGQGHYIDIIQVNKK